MESTIKNSNVDIFIYSHIPFKPIAQDHVFKVLTTSHEEAKKFNTDLEILRDYTGTNIADKNLMYNEYSGFYWLWKNYPLKDYIGLNHYRRMYVNFNNLPDINEIFKTKKIILNEPINMVVPQQMDKGGTKMNNREWYDYWHNVEDFDLLGEIIKEQFPNYYDGFEVMSKSDHIYPCSLFIMDKKTFIEYCEFIFGVLNAFRKERGFYSVDDCVKYVEEHQDKYLNKGAGHGYYDTHMQARIVGYLAERALATFLMHGGEDSLENNAEIFKWGMVPEQMYKVE